MFHFETGNTQLEGITMEIWNVTLSLMLIMTLKVYVRDSKLHLAWNLNSYLFI